MGRSAPQPALNFVLNKRSRCTVTKKQGDITGKGNVSLLFCSLASAYAHQVQEATMKLTIEQCRKFLTLEVNASLSDQEVERIRDEMYALAEIAVASFISSHPPSDAGVENDIPDGPSQCGREEYSKSNPRFPQR